MPEPEANGSERGGGKKVSCEFVVSGGDAPEVFEFVKEALDEVALAVDLPFDEARHPNIALRGDVCDGAGGFDPGDNGVREVTAISDDVTRQCDAVDQRRKRGLVGRLAGCQQKPDGQAMGIDNGVDLGAQSPTRTTDGVIRAPLFPPAACWWARTIEESIR